MRIYGSYSYKLVSQQVVVPGSHWQMTRSMLAVRCGTSLHPSEQSSQVEQVELVKHACTIFDHIDDIQKAMHQRTELGRLVASYQEPLTF